MPGIIAPGCGRPVKTIALFRQKDYTLALAKETVGRIRSKFQVDGSPYQLDGERLISEAQSAKQDLESKLTGTIFII